MFHRLSVWRCPGTGRRHSITHVGLAVLALCGSVFAETGNQEHQFPSLAEVDAIPHIAGAPEGLASSEPDLDSWETRLTSWRTLTADELGVAASDVLQQLDGSDAPGLHAGTLGRREGDLDSTFSHHPDEPGVRRDSINVGNTPSDVAIGVAQRADGKVYLIGQSGGLGATTRIAIVRLTASTLNRDPRFGDGGLQVIELDHPRLRLIKAVPYMVDGYERFYILAEDRNHGMNRDFALICLRTPFVLTDGAFEACPGFGSAAGVPVRFYAFDQATGCDTQHDVPSDIVLDRRPYQPARLYLAGSAQHRFNNCLDTDLALIRTTVNGAPDTTFASTGKLTLSIPTVAGTGEWSATALAVTPLQSGEVMVGGAVGTGSDRRAVLVQFKDDGTLNPSFCAPTDPTCDSPMSHRAGVRAWSADETSSSVRALVATPDNAVYVGRSVTTNVSQTVGRLSRVARSGGCDVFCGQVSMMPAFSTHTAPVALAYHNATGSNGQITVAAYSFAAGLPDRSSILVYRFSETASTNNLQPDVAFTTGPTTARNTITVPGNVGAPRNTRPNVMTVDREGRYLVAGYTTWEGEDVDFAFARLQRDVIFINGLND